MVKKEAYKKLGGYREDFIYAQDYDFILRAIDSNFIIENMPDVVLGYRDVQSESPSTKTHRQLYLGRQAIRLHKERVRYGVESGESLEKVKKSFFLAGFLFSSSLKLRKATLGAELPSFLKYIFAFVSSLLHYEVFYDSVRGFRLKVIRARRK
jgi:GT2 family glycosyltransferase